MATELRWKSSDLLLLPDDGKRYEIIDGELYVSKQPSWEHQFVAQNVAAASPLLPGFDRPVASFFVGLPVEASAQVEDE